MIYLIKFWREIAILILTILVIFVYLWKDNQAKALEIDLAQYKSGLEFQNATILKEAEEHKRKLAELPKEIVKIKTRYEVIYENIDTWEGDKNVSDCENALTFMHSFNY
ncbi:MAG: hypothetical protein WC464_00295 [Bdellovibrionales bacterium]|jgi:hypothetical protein